MSDTTFGQFGYQKYNSELFNNTVVDPITELFHKSLFGFSLNCLVCKSIFIKVLYCLFYWSVFDTDLGLFVSWLLLIGLQAVCLIILLLIWDLNCLLHKSVLWYRLWTVCFIKFLFIHTLYILFIRLWNICFITLLLIQLLIFLKFSCSHALKLFDGPRTICCINMLLVQLNSLFYKSIVYIEFAQFSYIDQNSIQQAKTFQPNNSVYLQISTTTGNPHSCSFQFIKAAPHRQ